MKQTPGKSVADRDRYWTNIIREGQEYPGSATLYCRHKGVAKSSYYLWFKRLRPMHPEWHDLANNLPVKDSESKKMVRQPDTEVVERARRRKFSASDKSRILRETDTASSGQVAAILRREGLYTSHLQKWRAERDEHALSPKKRGPKVNPLARENRKLKAKNARLEKKLEQAHGLIEFQKKIAEILGTTLQKSD